MKEIHQDQKRAVRMVQTIPEVHQSYNAESHQERFVPVGIQSPKDSKHCVSHNQNETVGSNYLEFDSSHVIIPEFQDIEVQEKSDTNEPIISNKTLNIDDASLSGSSFPNCHTSTGSNNSCTTDDSNTEAVSEIDKSFKRFFKESLSKIGKGWILIRYPITWLFTTLFRKITLRNIRKEPIVSSGTLGEFPPYTIALSCQHILEKVLSLTEPADLFKCRMVCRQWESKSTLQLQKQISSHIWKVKESYKMENGRLLEDLTAFLRKNKKSFSIYPCREFIFKGGNLSNKSIQNFLNVQGEYIKKFTLLFSSWNFDPKEHEKCIIELVKDLLCRQTPNLEYLKLDIYPIIEWKHNSTRGLRSPLKTTDSEFKEIHSENFVKYLTLNQNLKVFDFGVSTSSKVFETVIRMAPCLEEIIVVHDNYPFLLEPFERLRYLKKLKIHDYALIKMETMVLTGNLKPTSIHLSLLLLTKYCESYVPVGIINRILECSSDSLEYIHWNPATNLQGFRWPILMPNVRRLHLGCPKDDRIAQGLFCQGVCLANVFPKLRSIRLDVFEERTQFIKLVNSLNFDPVLIVNLVQLFCISFNGDPVMPDDLQLLLTLFPNATVKMCEVPEINAATHKKLICKPNGKEYIYYSI